MEYEDGERNLSDLIIWAEKHIDKRNRNEATTRLHLIDQLFFGCLGWEREDCVAEEHVNGKFVDYSFRCPQCMLVVEAKKEGLYFELPVGKTKQKQDIKYFKSNYPKVYKAIEQAVKYCQNHGTPYGVVSNGHQIIAFIGSRTDGNSPIDGKVVIFDSLKNLNDNFLIAWQCLSKSGIMSHRLSVELQDVNIAVVPEKLSKRINNYPGFKRRNQLQTDLQILGELFIEDIARQSIKSDEKEFLKECYCESGALSQYAEISRNVLKARYSVIFQDEIGSPTLTPATTKKGLHRDFIAKSLSGRPILLIGDIGVGKTMFIKHLYQVREPEIFEDAVVFYIDLGRNPALDGELRQFIEHEIVNQLLEKYHINIYERNFVHGVLHRDIELFNKGIYADIREKNPTEFKDRQLEFIEDKMGDTESYLKKCLNHIERGHKKQLVLFMDNVDQRFYEFQDRAFLVAESITDNWPMTVFLTIRPETFYRSKISGAISAYHPRAFTIAPPRVDEVINRRLSYGLKTIQSRGFQLSSDILLKSERLEEYLKILIYSFNNNFHLMQFLDSMAGGNIRLALAFVRAFIGSGHIDTSKILEKYKSQGDYLVSLHEFFRAVIYGDHEHFNPDSSEIVNIFDISTPDGREHFLCPILLAQLDRWSQSSNSEGFVPVSDIYKHAQKLGFNPNQIEWAINRLLYRNLIELPTKLRESQKPLPKNNYRITSTGSYYINRLVRQFTYLDAMIVDTPIVDREYRDKINDVGDIRDRIDRAKNFSDYLNSQWGKLSAYDLAFSWLSVRLSLRRNRDYIAGKI